MKFKSILYGKGKAGNIVGVSGYNGEYYIKNHQPKIKNPKTEQQQYHRDRFAVLSKFLSPFAGWANLFLRNTHETGWTKLIKINWQENVIESNGNDFFVAYQKIKVSAGSLRSLIVLRAIVFEGSIVVNWDNSQITEDEKYETVGIILYNENQKKVLEVYVKRWEGKIKVPIPRFWYDNIIHGWIASTNFSKSSNSKYLGTWHPQ